MRLNKMKLAAAMMSAVMAASSMPVTAFAADFTDGGAGVEAQADFAAEAVEVVETPEAAVDAEITIVDAWITEDGKVHVEYDDGSEDTTTYKATSTVKPATCTTGKITTWTSTEKIVIDGEAKYIYAMFNDEKPLGHKEGKTVTTFTPADTGCQDGGTITSYVECSVCGLKIPNTEKSEPAAAREHKFEVTSVTYSDLDNAKQDTPNSVPVLDKEDEDGSYKKVVTKICTVCKETKEEEETVNLYSNVNSKTLVEEFDNIEDARVQNKMTLEEFEALGEIELTDCGKDGSYDVVRYSKDDHEISRNTVIIKAHHTAKAPKAVAATTAETNLLRPVTDKEGKIVDYVTKSCYKSVEYDWIEECKSNKCTLPDRVISKTTKTAEPGDPHAAKASASALVVDLQNGAKETKTEDVAAAYYNFMKEANKENSGIKYESTIDCEKGGVVTIKYLCSVCGAETEDKAVEVKLPALEHKRTITKTENEVKATCNEDGHYDAVTYCAFCDKELERKTVTTKKHIPEFAGKSFDEFGVKFEGDVVVDKSPVYTASSTVKANANGKYVVGKYDDFAVTAKAYRTCKICGSEYVYTTDPAGYKVEIVNVTKELPNGAPGSITLKASYTATIDGKSQTITTGDVTFDYYSNLVAFLERNPEAKKNGLVRDDDGVFRYYKDGVFQKDYTGLVDFNGETFYVENGVDTYKDGVVRTGEKTFYFLSLGRVVKEHNGFAMYDGNWFIIKDGKVDLTANGLFKYNGGTFLFTTGGLRRDVTGLWLEESTGTWYYLHEGQVQDQFTGTTWYDGQQFELVNGKLVK